MKNNKIPWYAIFHLIMVPLMVPSLKIQNNQKIQDLIKKWAPVVWLAPQEIYYPLSIEEFLENIYPGTINGTPVNTQGLLPQGIESENIYLYPKINIEELKKLSSSFLNGKDPEENLVPIYATYQTCDNSRSNEVSDDINFHVTYWMFYPYNQGKKFCFWGKIPTPWFFAKCLGKAKYLGDHLGDFEHVSMVFRNGENPNEIYLSTHNTGAYYKYDPRSLVYTYTRQVSGVRLAQKGYFPKKLSVRNGRLALFSALGSHGLWATPGQHYFTQIPGLYDFNGFGKRWDTRRALQIFDQNLPAWLKFKGHWGHPKSNCLFSKIGICEISDGPVGILHRKLDFECKK